MNLRRQEFSSKDLVKAVWNRMDESEKISIGSGYVPEWLKIYDLDAREIDELIQRSKFLRKREYEIKS